MTTAEWTEAVRRWADAQQDISALVQIGSRVQPGAPVDAWSDFDYQLITSTPKKYSSGSFVTAIGSCWTYGVAHAFGGVTKVSAVYSDALEADFVILKTIEVRLLTTALRFPKTARSWPAPLAHGVGDFRRVAGLGWKVIKGGVPWERRYSRVSHHRKALDEYRFREITQAFWTHSVWVAKKAQRGEYTAARRGYHETLMEVALELFEEEALIDGKAAAPLGRRAEQWLGDSRLIAVKESAGPGRVSLLHAIAQLSAAVHEASENLAVRRSWPLPQSDEVRRWLAEQGATSSGDLTAR